MTGGRVGAIVAAAGRGERLGAAVAKALVPVGGVPLVVHACRVLTEAGVTAVVVTAPPADVAAFVEAIGTLGAPVPSVDVVAGGETRVASVRLGLAALDRDVDIVVVHDAARAFAPVTLVRTVVDAVVAGADAVVPVVPIADTVKEVDDDGRVVDTPDRSRLRAAQTPQAFRRAVIEAAHAAAVASGAVGTDDAALVEAIGGVVSTVAGSTEAFKVTTSSDLAVAETLLRERVSS